MPRLQTGNGKVTNRCLILAKKEIIVSDWVGKKLNQENHSQHNDWKHLFSLMRYAARELTININGLKRPSSQLSPFRVHSSA